jgi:hypothetical protein
VPLPDPNSCTNFLDNSSNDEYIKDESTKPEIRLIPNVSTRPSLVFTEIVEGKEIQSFKIVPRSEAGGGGTFIIGGGSEVPLKRERVLEDLGYPASGGEMLTEQFKRQFDQTFKECFMIAYAR